MILIHYNIKFFLAFAVFGIKDFQCITTFLLLDVGPCSSTTWHLTLKGFVNSTYVFFIVRVSILGLWFFYP
jgi:hypothetical protein